MKVKSKCMIFSDYHSNEIATVFHDWRFLKNIVSWGKCLVSPLFTTHPCIHHVYVLLCQQPKIFNTIVFKKIDLRPKWSRFRWMKSLTKTVTFSATLLEQFACVSTYFLFVLKVQQINMAALYHHQKWRIWLIAKELYYNRFKLWIKQIHNSIWSSVTQLPKLNYRNVIFSFCPAK